MTTVDPTATVTTGVPSECGDIVLPPGGADHAGRLAAGRRATTSRSSCGGVGGTDLEVVWTAPVTGRFQFDTIGSNFDSLLAVLDGVCSGQGWP